jgi:hypothetical protein
MPLGLGKDGRVTPTWYVSLISAERRYNNGIKSSYTTQNTVIFLSFSPKQINTLTVYQDNDKLLVL